MLLRNKKRGQVAETVTWLVATIVILVILSMAVYTASVLSKTNRSVTISADKFPILLKKSLQGYLLTKDGNENVFTKVEESRGLDSFSSELGKKIFKDPSGEFSFSLYINPISGVRSYEEIRINKDLNLGVILSNDGKKTATI